MMNFGTYDKFSALYPKLCYAVLRAQESGPRGLKTRDLGSVHFRLTNGEDPGLFRSEVRSTSLRYFAAESLWYFMGDDSIDYIANYAKLWARIADEDGKVNSNYGRRVWHTVGPSGMTEWMWVISKILDDPDTRQAVIPIHKLQDHDPRSKDIPCTMVLGFRTSPSPMSKREREVDMHVTMRSSDIHFGLPYDVPFFKLLQRLLCVHLNQAQDEVEYVPGYYEHHSYSLHAYEKDWETLNKLLIKEVHPVSGLPSLDVPPITADGYIDHSSPFIAWAKARTSLGDDQP